MHWLDVSKIYTYNRAPTHSRAPAHNRASTHNREPAYNRAPVYPDIMLKTIISDSLRNFQPIT